MVSEEDVKKIAKLSNLNLSENEAKKYSSELSSILGYIAQLEKLDTSKVAPTSHVHNSTNVFREDVVIESMPIEEGLKNAPSTSGRYIKVPLIVEGSGEH